MSERTYPYGYKSLHGGGTGRGAPTSQEVSVSNRRARVQSKKAYKMLLIGESSVGKTTLAVRLCEDRFLANPSSKPTLGEFVHFKRLVLFLMYATTTQCI